MSASLAKVRTLFRIHKLSELLFVGRVRICRHSYCKMQNAKCKGARAEPKARFRAMPSDACSRRSQMQRSESRAESSQSGCSSRETMQSYSIRNAGGEKNPSGESLVKEMVKVLGPGESFQPSGESLVKVW